MRVALDTSVIMRLVNRNDPAHDETRACLDALGGQHELCIAPQVFYELWVVLTRAIEANGLGLELPAARSLTEGLQRLATLLPDPPRLVSVWLDLCMAHGIKGRAAHDARIAAWMTTYGITHLLTRNAPDFARISDVVAVEPRPGVELK